MARLIVSVVVLLGVFSSAASAQEQEIFNLLRQKVQQELDRQQKKLNRKLVQQHYLQDKAACENGNLSGCDQALRYPEISDQDRDLIAKRRAEIVAIQGQSQARSVSSDSDRKPQDKPDGVQTETLGRPPPSGSQLPSEQNFQGQGTPERHVQASPPTNCPFAVGSPEYESCMRGYGLGGLGTYGGKGPGPLVLPPGGTGKPDVAATYDDSKDRKECAQRARKPKLYSPYGLVQDPLEYQVCMRLKKEKRDAEASQEKARDELARKQTEYFREADTLGAAYAKRLGIEQLALLPNRTFSWMFTYPMDHRYDVATCKYLNAHDVGKFTKCLNDFEDSFHDEERRATILREAHAHRDRSDVVAQVLNYTVTGYEDGDSDRFGDRFWFTEHPGSCVYRFSQPNNYNNGTALDLSKLDPKNLTITDDLQKPLFGGLESVTVVLHEGHELLRGTKQTDPERVRRGWDLIYSKYCHGMEKAF